MDESVARRKITPTTTQPSPAAFASTFETSYRSAYVPEGGAALKGDRFPRAPKVRSEMASVMSMSGTTMADAVPTQRQSYKPPVAATTERLGKIQQPKAKDFRPVALQPAQTKCV
jgi:hypothetical protein